MILFDVILDKVRPFYLLIPSKKQFEAMKIEGINSLLRGISDGRVTRGQSFSLLSHIPLSKAYLFLAGKV